MNTLLQLKQQLQQVMMRQDYTGLSTLCDNALDQGIDDPGVYQPAFQHLYSSGRYARLAPLLKKLLALRSDFAPGYQVLVTCYRHLQQHEEALKVIELAITLFSANGALCNQQGLLFQEMGRWAEAQQAFDRALALSPQFSEAFYNRARLEKVFPANWHSEVLGAYEDAESDKDKAYYSYALAFAEKDNPDTYFKWVSTAARHKRATIDYSEETELAELSKAEAVFTPAFLGSGKGHNSERPVFICGLPRSGTTLVEQILASHDDISAGDELFELARCSAEVASKSAPGSAFPFWAERLDDNDWRTIAERYLENTGYLHHTRYFTDKMPLNFKALGVIKRTFPNARVIHCRRDAMATLFSCFENHFGGGVGFSYDLAELGRYYRAYASLMKHYRAHFGENLFEIDYETLVSDPEVQIRRMLGFLALPWQDECLSFYRREGVVHTASQQQVRQPLYTDSIARWRRFEKQLMPLKKELSAD